MYPLCENSRGMGSGSLADQFNRPSGEHIAPARRFGIAVDGGEGFFENESEDSGQVVRREFI